jgi:pimeloyl-ACP methyl ester carboxylesterase
MRVSSETSSDGVVERLFLVNNVPGVLWSPVSPDGPRPLILLGHGGGSQHKKVPRLVARAQRYVQDCGFVVAAIDAPGHGDRPRTEADESLLTETRLRIQAGQPIAEAMARYNEILAPRIIPDWQSVLTALLGWDELTLSGEVGYFGVSMGTGFGIPLVAAEPRIHAAVLGLAAGQALAGAAARITVPVEFLLQWDDELVTRDAALALFDALGSKEKTLHANPGGHGEIPEYEVESSQRFFVRHLLKAGPS